MVEIVSVKSNYAPVKSKISTSPSSSFVLSAKTQRFAVTDSHPYAFSFSPTPSEYGSNFKSTERVGFEPTEETLTDFRDPHLKPLGHLSIKKYYHKKNSLQRLNFYPF